MTRRIPDQDLEDGKDELRAMLWLRNLKTTSGRLAILEVLRKEKEPLSVAEIESALLKSNPDATPGYATIYRTLEVLAKATLVNRINTGDAHSSYELNFGRKHHHHAVCTSCGLIEDIANCDSEELNISARAHLKNFKSIQSHSLEFFGLCRKCEEKGPR